MILDHLAVITHSPQMFSGKLRDLYPLCNKIHKRQLLGISATEYDILKEDIQKTWRLRVILILIK